ncbi:MAG: hypothetical protein ACK4GR_04205, partial [bacterium]
SSVRELNIIKVSNVTKKSYLVGLQSTVQKYKNNKIYINIKEDEKLISLKNLKVKDANNSKLKTK